MESVENKPKWTDEEKALAKKYRVEPKTIRMISEIVAEHTKEVDRLIKFIDGESETRADEDKCQDFITAFKVIAQKAKETSEQEPSQEDKEVSLHEQTEARIRNYYKNLDVKTKLAIITFNELEPLDGINFQSQKPRDERLIEQILDDLESSCVEAFHRDPDDVADIAFGVLDIEDVWLCGVWETSQMVLQNC